MDAINKINKEYVEGKGKLSREGKVVGNSVVKVLSNFCMENSEFAQAVMQTKKTVCQCIESTVKGCGGAIADIDVYRKAASFYFEGATVHFNMVIDLGDGGFSNATAKVADNAPELISAPVTHSGKMLELSLDALFD